jgi:predicted acylesterase/phospholipase RssA
VANEDLKELVGVAPSGFGAQHSFQHVFLKEADVISERRGNADPRGPLLLEVEAKDMVGQPVLRPRANAGLVGLALSGGGIRSAAFCLGVLQALHKNKVLDRVDYLSTVSGGGYIGCSLTAAQQAGAAQGYPGFPFASALKEDEPLALQHIRDYSNYLFPRSGSSEDLLRNAAIYARGLVVNAVLLIPFLFGAAVITLLYYALRNAVTGFSLFNPLGLRYFFISLDLFLFLLLVGIGWGLYQSTQARQQQTEIPGGPSTWVGRIIIAFLIVVFCELQPLILDSMIGASSDLAKAVTGWVKTISAILAPVSAALAFLSAKVGEYLKSAMQSTSLTTQAKGLAMKAAVVVGGLVLPVLLWMLYLNVAYWGLCLNGYCSCAMPSWLMAAAGAHPVLIGHAATLLYLIIALLFFALSLRMRPNANSLHPLYRDRLSKAFLFQPWPRKARAQPQPQVQARPQPQAQIQPQAEVQAQPQANISKPWPVDPNQIDLVEEWRPKLSEITGLNGPYHLINTALNVEASKVANRRGRNADFFFFSPRFVGSKSTGYVLTTDIEEVATGLTLATAMATSGAAVSSSMGAETIKPLTATLALLNVRLGYWLRNPNELQFAKRRSAINRLIGKSEWLNKKLRLAARRKIDRRNPWANYYFIAELFGLLSENFKSVYLTDGGHIENLGIYELLRRRCQVIIAVDAEADPEMAFGSFNTLERYALIDMGVRIDLPWQPIAKMSVTTGGDLDKDGGAPKNPGPHCAIGEISYPDDRKGVLIYIKASLTGDENDTVIDYKKRYSDFPHETTLDQMFTEEQFEAYRALGFHAANNLFDHSDNFARLDPATNPTVWPAFERLDQLFPCVDPETPRAMATFAATLPAPARRRRPPVAPDPAAPNATSHS